MDRGCEKPGKAGFPNNDVRSVTSAMHRLSCKIVVGPRRGGHAGTGRFTFTQRWRRVDRRGLCEFSRRVTQVS